MKKEKIKVKLEVEDPMPKSIAHQLLHFSIKKKKVSGVSLKTTILSEYDEPLSECDKVNIYSGDTVILEIPFDFKVEV